MLRVVVKGQAGRAFWKPVGFKITYSSCGREGEMGRRALATLMSLHGALRGGQARATEGRWSGRGGGRYWGFWL